VVIVCQLVVIKKVLWLWFGKGWFSEVCPRWKLREKNRQAFCAPVMGLVYYYFSVVVVVFCLVQCSKLLSDTSVIQFYPSKFVLITDILDNFGKDHRK